MISYKRLRTNKWAFCKAQIEQPVVLKVGNGYVVLGASGIYTVTVAADYSVACTCTAGKYDKFCYHAAAALLAQLEVNASNDIEAAGEVYEESEDARLYESENPLNN